MYGTPIGYYDTVLQTRNKESCVCHANMCVMPITCTCNGNTSCFITRTQLMRRCASLC